MGERLTDEQVWLKCYCAGLIRGLESRAVDVATRGVEEFRKQFPKTKFPEAIPPLPSLLWNDCDVNRTLFEVKDHDHYLSVRREPNGNPDEEWVWGVFPAGNIPFKREWKGRCKSENIAKYEAEQASKEQRKIERQR